MSSYTEKDRIDLFMDLMKPYISKKNSSIGCLITASLQPPLPFITTGHIQGRCSITAWLLLIPYYRSQNALN